jgi:hypothetical protein
LGWSDETQFGNHYHLPYLLITCGCAAVVLESVPLLEQVPPIYQERTRGSTIQNTTKRLRPAWKP